MALGHRQRSARTAGEAGGDEAQRMHRQEARVAPHRLHRARGRLERSVARIEAGDDEDTALVGGTPEPLWRALAPRLGIEDEHQRRALAGVEGRRKVHRMTRIARGRAHRRDHASARQRRREDRCAAGCRRDDASMRGDGARA